GPVFVAAPVVDDHARALGAERPRVGAANAAAGAGDDGHLAGEEIGHGSSPRHEGGKVEPPTARAQHGRWAVPPSLPHVGISIFRVTAKPSIVERPQDWRPPLPPATSTMKPSGFWAMGTRSSRTPRSCSAR